MTYEYGGKDTSTFVKLYGYKNLVVWQKASDLSVLVNQASGNFGHGYYKLTDQMRGAASSVTANIAEGYCNASLANYIRFCLIARGSLGELGSYLQDCERWGLLGGDSLAKMISLYGDTTFLLDRLIHSLREKEKDGSWDKQFWAKEQGEIYDTGDADQM
ncbi:MAG TPA: four helix bundle protein [Anaerolineae bacterium]